MSGIQKHFLREREGKLYMTGCCAVSGLGPADNPRRDGTLDYYFSEPVVENDGKALGPFLKLAVACDLR